MELSTKLLEKNSNNALDIKINIHIGLMDESNTLMHRFHETMQYVHLGDQYHIEIYDFLNKHGLEPTDQEMMWQSCRDNLSQWLDHQAARLPTSSPHNSSSLLTTPTAHQTTQEDIQYFDAFIVYCTDELLLKKMNDYLRLSHPNSFIITLIENRDFFLAMNMIKDAQVATMELLSPSVVVLKRIIKEISQLV